MSMWISLRRREAEGVFRLPGAAVGFREARAERRARSRRRGTCR